LFYWVLRVLVGPLLRAYFRPWVRGAHHVPSSGPAILASNHLAVIDSFVLPIVIPRKVRFIGKAEYFTGRGITGRLKAGFFRGVGTIPVDRGGGKASEAALRTGLAVLEEGGLFGIYPEGTRSRDGRLYRGRTGVGWLALAAQCPVVPVALTGTDKLQPVGARFPRLVRIRVEFGDPIDVVGRFDHLPAGRARRLVTDEVMAAIHAMSGQELAGEYNRRASSASP